jgi:3-phytase
MLRGTPTVFRLACVLALVLAAGASSAAAGGRDKAPTLEFLGEEILPTGLQFEGTEVGGLSSIAYDADRDRYYVISDDQSVIDPARFYTFDLDVADGDLDPGDVVVTDVTTLLDAAGQPFAAASFDPEGLALTKDRELVITSEGIATRLIPPWVRLFGLDGAQLDDLPVPLAFIPDAIPQTRGVRQNLGFESGATVGPYFFTGSEGALVQDGPAASLTEESPARLLRYNLKTGRPDRQYVYWTDTIAEPPVPATNFAVNGLVELLPLDKRSFLSMERSFSVGAPGTGNTIKLYTVELAGAKNVNGRESLAGQLDRIRPVKKRLLLDLDALGIPLDNIEGMAFGPDLANGRRTLVLVSDNNFAPAQFTQFLLFAFSEK